MGNLVNFNQSSDFANALADSAINTNTLYFPSDNYAIVKDGKIYGSSMQFEYINNSTTSATTIEIYNNNTYILSNTTPGIVINITPVEITNKYVFARILFKTHSSTNFTFSIGQVKNIGEVSVNDIYPHGSMLLGNTAFQKNIIQ